MYSAIEPLQSNIFAVLRQASQRAAWKAWSRNGFHGVGFTFSSLCFLVLGSVARAQDHNHRPRIPQLNRVFHIQILHSTGNSNYTYIYMHISIYTHIYIHTYMEVYIYTHIHVYLYVCIYIYTYRIHIHIYMHMHIHPTQVQRLFTGRKPNTTRERNPTAHAQAPQQNNHETERIGPGSHDTPSLYICPQRQSLDIPEHSGSSRCLHGNPRKQAQPRLALTSETAM